MARDRSEKNGAVEANNGAASTGSGRLATKTDSGETGDGEFTKSTGRKGPPATNLRQPFRFGSFAAEPGAVGHPASNSNAAGTAASTGIFSNTCRRRTEPSNKETGPTRSYPPREETGQPAAPSPTPRRSGESQNQKHEGPPSTSSPSGTPRAETPAPAESPTPRRSIERREQEHQTTKPTPSHSEESRSHTPATDQLPSKEQPGERTKEQSNEPRKAIESRGDQPAEDRATDRTSRSENQPETRKGQPGERQRSPEAKPRVEEKQSDRTNPDHDKSEKQESKKPRKEEPKSE